MLTQYFPGMTTSESDALQAWRSIVGLVQEVAENGPAGGRAGFGSMSVHETVHHIVEANVVAASIVIAALGSPGCVYDWSWMLPFGPWMERLRYADKPLGPALKLLEALNAYVAAQIEPLSDGLQRTVRLRDEPDGPLRTATVADVLLQEALHAREHVDELRA